MKSWLIALCTAFLLTGCLDSGSSGSSNTGSVPAQSSPTTESTAEKPSQTVQQTEPVALADITGIWHVENVAGDDPYKAVMVLTSDGKAVINDLDAAIYGTVTVNNGKLTITGHSYYESVASVTITSTANPDKMTLAATSSDGNVSVLATRNQKHKDLYKAGANLADLAGTYTDDPDYEGSYDVSGTAVIDTQGNLTFTATGCTVTGKLSTINTAFNEYGIEFNTAGCTASFTSGIYKGVAVKYENSQGKQGLSAVGVLGDQEAVWFLGVK